MADSILDRLDREHGGGARQYIANLFVVGGATREQVAEKLAEKYSIPAPTGRSISKWKNEDAELRELIRQMEAAKRDLAPGDDPTALLPRREVSREAASERLFTFAVTSPAFAKLLKRDGPGGEDDSGGWGFDDYAAHPGPDVDDGPDDVLAVLIAGHETAEAFEVDCERRLAAATAETAATP